jgi:deazaflavin-dependent oxidoreductase (nitroreductase family)
MPEYIPSPTDWVREQVELIESSGGKEGMALRGMRVVLVTMTGHKTGAVRKVPLMRAVTEDGTYVLVASRGGAPEHPLWYHNLQANPEITIRDGERVFEGRVREVADPDERARLWDVAVAAFPLYEEYQQRTERVIPVFAVDPA